MRKAQKFSAAMIVAAMMASGMTIFSTPVYASSSVTRVSGICKLLASAEAAVNTLPTSSFKTYLLQQLDAAELKYGC